jgi:hypothetical protein
MSADLLAFTVPTFPHAEDPNPLTRTGRRYPGVNHLGKDVYRKGRKTREYHALFAIIKDRAELELASSGWSTADYYCEVVIRRISVTRHLADSTNGWKCELDALEAAGVFTNDALVVPRPDIVQYDPTPGAIDRISIAVFRLFPPLLLVDASRNSETIKTTARRKGSQPVAGGARTGNRVTTSIDSLKQGQKLTFDQRDALLWRS